MSEHAVPPTLSAVRASALRRRSCVHLRRSGPSSPDAIATAIGASRSGVAQQLRALDSAGLVTRTAVRHGVGRPRHLYDVTADAQDLFPSNYDGLATGLLAAIIEVGGDALLEDVFAARRRQAGARAAGAAGRGAAAGRPARRPRRASWPASRTSWATSPRRGSTTTASACVQHNCAVLRHRARQRRRPAGPSSTLFREVLGADVVRERHIAAGDRCCKYRVAAIRRRPEPRGTAGRPRRRVADAALSPPRAPRPRGGPARGAGSGTSETLGTNDAASDVAATCCCSSTDRMPEAAEGRQLVADVRLEHLRAVGADGVAHAVAAELVEDPAELVPAGHDARVEVGRGADLQHDPALAEHGHRARVVGSLHAVADAVGLEQLDDAGDLLDRSGLAGVDRDARGRAGAPAGRAAGSRRRGTWPTPGPAMSTPTTPRSRQAIAFSTMISLSSYGNARSRQKIRPGLTGYSSVARSMPADRRRDDVVEVLLAAAVPLHRVEAQLHRGDVVLAVGAADDLVDRALDGDRARLDELGPVEQLQVAVEALRAPRVDRDQVAELPVVAGRAA